jgi:cyclic-di-GMP phosphodiesterase TipF (flagellum assembly factor)
MPAISHVLIALGYAVVAGAVTVALPHMIPQLDVRGAVEIGAIIILVAALVHLASARLRRGDEEARDIDAVRSGYGELRHELARARDEARQIYEAIRTVTEQRQGQAQEIETVMTEVRVLQTLVEQLSSGKPAKAKPAYLVDGSTDKSVARPETPQPPRVLSGLPDDEVLEMVREALRDNRVDLFVQPIVSLPQRKRRHYECFSRIRAEDGSILLPDSYIGVAERAGLMAAIDNMLLFRGVQLVRRVQKNNAEVSIFVNISEHTLSDVRFLREFVTFMAANRDLAPYLVFEFSQASVERHRETGLKELDRLGNLGFRLSMDQVTSIDFDIEELKSLHIRFLKIEAAKLIEQTRATRQRLDMRAFKQALDRQAVDLIVEKIESEATMVEILDMPVDFGQGYLFGEPRLSKDAREAA